jgi:predicted nucleic acid-binding protein
LSGAACSSGATSGRTFNDDRTHAAPPSVLHHDLRIAAIGVAHSATLISRYRWDFERVPGLSVEFWE